MTILITGGAGFIGSHLIRHLVKSYPDYNLINLDALTYASDLSRVDDVNNAPNYQFVEGNINDTAILDSLFSTYSIEAVIHLAAESHVDRSIGLCLLQKPISLARLTCSTPVAPIGKKGQIIGSIT